MTAASRDNPAARVLILAGTTASGKTGVSIPLARMLDGEIISADSRQIFRDLNIGTAKPTAEQQAAVPHHFIDELSIEQKWTAGDFGREARKRVEQILAGNRTPLVVGGSMLYLRAFVDGFYEAEEPDIDYGELREEFKERGADALYEELSERDPELALQTDPHDHHRILRGIAVHRATGQRLSELQQRPCESLGHFFRMFFLYGDRDQTYDRVNRRAEQMVRDGLVKEVRGLFEKGYNEQNCNALRTHGYQEVFPHLRGEITAVDMLEDIQKAVRHYVKRQMTWFRKEPRAEWIYRSFEEPDSEVAERIADKFRI